jgi:hypothetical protein
MTQAKLFKPARVCICCGESATVGRAVDVEPSVLSINSGIYRRGLARGSQKAPRSLKAARAICICERCFVLARASSWSGGPSKEGRKLLSALLEVLSACYNAILEHDEAA